MFENLAKTIVVTGAMLPIERLESDTTRNLILSIVIAAVSHMPEVVVVFRDYVLRGNRTKKLDSESLNAFMSPNFPPLAIISTELTVQRSIVLPFPNTALSSALLIVHKRMEQNIVAIRLIPGFCDDSIRILSELPSIKAIILELYGAGNAPKKTLLIDAVKNAVQRGVIVMIVSQCPKGFVDLKAYSSGRQMLEAGAISAGDMTFEACSMKLAHLLGHQPPHPIEIVKRLMKQSLRGELTSGEMLSEARFLDCIIMKDVDHLVSPF